MTVISLLHWHMAVLNGNIQNSQSSKTDVPYNGEGKDMEDDEEKQMIESVLKKGFNKITEQKV